MIRKMGDLNIIQRTLDGYFNATELLKLWNNKNPFEERALDNFWKSTHLDKLMSEIVKNEFNIESVDFTYLKSVLSITQRGKKELLN